MHVAGFMRSSLIDYPGKISAVVFTQGCNFRCPFCHNPELIVLKKHPAEDSLGPLIAFLQKRRQQLDGVVITGGEPTLQQELASFLEIVKGYGYAIKLDTNGSRPLILRHLIDAKLVDYVAMDVKAPWSCMQKATGCSINPEILKESIDVLHRSGLPHEFRTTAVKPIHQSTDDLIEIGRSVKGAGTYVLQTFRSGQLLDPDFSEIAEPFTAAELEDARRKLMDEGIACTVR